MKQLNLVLYPDAPLRDVAEPVEKFDSALRDLVQQMLETMRAHDGVGLAGPQVGISRRLFVLHEPDEEEPRCLVNPEIYEREGTERGEEGCLSLPEIYAPVERAARIRVRAWDQKGNRLDFPAEGLLARIIQHENDHLDGICFVDRLDILTRQERLEQWASVRERLLQPNFQKG